MDGKQDLEERQVVSDDPSLSPTANRLLTEELQAAVGAETVHVPRDTPDRHRRRHGDSGGFAEAAAANRVLIAITFFALLVVGAIVSLATGSWWAVVAAAVVHAIGTFIVLTALGNAAKQTEHVAPMVAAKLADEGVADPDAQLSELVEEFAGATGTANTADMVTTGRNEQTADPSTDPAAATAQQRTANTPAGVPTAPAGTGSGIDRMMPKWVVGALMVVAVVVGALSPVLGTRFLIVPAIGLPLGLLWLLLQSRMGGRREEAAARQGETLPAASGNRARVALTLVGVVVAVGLFVGLMGWVGDLV